MLFGGGLFGGLGGLSSIFGLILQIGLIVIVVRLAMSWWQRRQGRRAGVCRRHAGPAAPATSAPAGFWSRIGQRAARDPARRLRGIRAVARRDSGGVVERGCRQAAYAGDAGNGLVFHQDLEENKARNVVNKVSDVKLLQGDLAEAWREGDTDYASVAMRFSLIDKTLDRATGRLVEGSEQPTEVTEVWTFLRPRGGNWELSAIQQAN